ncbi:unnamed protein product [Sphagnum tenellum]
MDTSDCLKGRTVEVIYLTLNSRSLGLMETIQLWKMKMTKSHSIGSCGQSSGNHGPLGETKPMTLTVLQPGNAEREVEVKNRIKKWNTNRSRQMKAQF